MIKKRKEKEMGEKNEKEKKNDRSGFYIFIVVLIVSVIYGIMLVNISFVANQYEATIEHSNYVVRRAILGAHYKARVAEEDGIRNRIRELQPKLDEELAAKIARTVLLECERLSLSPSLVAHLIFRESSFNQMAVSSAGAIGLMGIMTKYHPEKCKPFSRNELFSIDVNIPIGCSILREYIDKSKSLTEALRKYVGGDHKTYSKDIFRMMAEYECGK